MSLRKSMAYDLICFDVDGTLIQNTSSSWQIFHSYFKVDEGIRKKAMDSYFSKEITYEQWALHDIELWKKAGKKRQDFWDAMKHAQISLMPGTKETLKILKENGKKLAIISGSINILLEYLLPDYEQIFDDIFFSYLLFNDEGEIHGIQATEYDMEGKALALKKIAEREGIPLERCAFIGDNHNDREIAKEAGLSIAFDAKDEELRKVSDIIIDDKDLTGIVPHILVQ
jgi:phosphoserine phosphatase